MTTRKIVEIQRSKYNDMDQRLHAILNTMTEREIELTSVARFAKDAHVSRATIYKHPDIFNRLRQNG